MPSYPASYTNSNVIAVTAITSSGVKSSFSNDGATSVDLGAPGSGIRSTVPKKSKGAVVSCFAFYGDISMGTPHVTGAATLYKAYTPLPRTRTPRARPRS